MKELIKMFFSSRENILINKTLATEIGLNESIVVRQLYYWIEKNESEGKNFRNGRYWTYGSVQELRERDFPFWSESTIKRVISNLVKTKILIVSNYNHETRDRTNWYSLDFDVLEEILGKYSHRVKLTQCNRSNCTNASGQNDTMHEVKLTRPLPENNTKNNTENNNTETTYDSIFTKTKLPSFKEKEKGFYCMNNLECNKEKEKDSRQFRIRDGIEVAEECLKQYPNWHIDGYSETGVPYYEPHPGEKIDSEGYDVLPFA